MGNMQPFSEGGHYCYCGLSVQGVKRGAIQMVLLLSHCIIVIGVNVDVFFYDMICFASFDLVDLYSDFVLLLVLLWVEPL